MSYSLKFLLITIIFLSNPLWADCLQKKPVEYLPINTLNEYCFTAPITLIRGISVDNALAEVETPDAIPQSYKDRGILGVLHITPLKESILNSFWVDTDDGERKEFQFIAINNELTEPKAEETVIIQPEEPVYQPRSKQRDVNFESLLSSIAFVMIDKQLSSACAKTITADNRERLTAPEHCEGLLNQLAAALSKEEVKVGINPADLDKFWALKQSYEEIIYYTQR